MRIRTLLAQLLILSPLLLAAALLVAMYAVHRRTCNRLFWWEVPEDCILRAADPRPACGWTDVCREEFDDAESRELWEDLYRHDRMR